MQRHPGFVRLDVDQAIFATASNPTRTADRLYTRPIVPCGNTSCMCFGGFGDSQKGWYIENQSRLDVWRQAPENVEKNRACGSHHGRGPHWHAHEPLLLHFNGSCKYILLHQAGDWVRRRLARTMLLLEGGGGGMHL